MNIHISENKDTSISFILQNAKPQDAASLRRIMMVEVPTIAVDKVNFFTNTSVFGDDDYLNKKWEEYSKTFKGEVPAE